ncbi:MAG: hypothetical protein VB141_13295 [Burkholderia gladioli]
MNSASGQLHAVAPRDIGGSITECGPYAETYMRGGYFVVADREFYWFEQLKGAKLDKRWQGIDADTLCAALHIRSRDAAFREACDHARRIREKAAA